MKPKQVWLICEREDEQEPVLSCASEELAEYYKERMDHVGGDGYMVKGPVDYVDEPDHLFFVEAFLSGAEREWSDDAEMWSVIDKPLFHERQEPFVEIDDSYFRVGVLVRSVADAVRIGSEQFPKFETERVRLGFGDRSADSVAERFDLR